MNQPRAYRSELREEQAQRTRALIAAAARACFVERGWAGTSVRSVADAAGVSEATVYAVYGSKAGLASSLLDAAEESADVTRAVAELTRYAGQPTEQLRAFVAFDRRLFELGGDVIRVIAEARRQHPDLGAAYVEGRRRGELNRAAVFGSWPRRTWRKGVDVAVAQDVYALLVCVETYAIATGERGWSPAETQEWWYRTLVELLLA